MIRFSRIAANVQQSFWNFQQSFWEFQGFKQMKKDVKNIIEEELQSLDSMEIKEKIKF